MIFKHLYAPVSPRPTPSHMRFSGNADQQPAGFLSPTCSLRNSTCARNVTDSYNRWSNFKVTSNRILLSSFFKPWFAQCWNIYLDASLHLILLPFLIHGVANGTFPGSSVEPFKGLAIITIPHLGWCGHVHQKISKKGIPNSFLQLIMFSKFWWSTRLFIVAVPPHPRCIFFTHPIFCWQLSDQNWYKLSQACSEYAISEVTGQFCLKSRENFLHVHFYSHLL